MASAPAFAGTDTYPSEWSGIPMDTVFDSWGEYNRECTSYVAWMLHSVNGFEMPFHADASAWVTDAEADGYTVNTTPAVGAVAWMGIGHVAWVEKVNSDGTVDTEDYNYSYNGTYAEHLNQPATTYQEYIHFKDITTGGVSGGGNSPPVQMDNLAFVNAQYYTGNAQVVAYTQSSNYTVTSQIDVTGAGDFSTPNVVPLFNPKNGDLCFVNTTYYTGLDQLNCYSEASNYATLDLSIQTPYSNNGTYNPYIIPLFEPDGDLAFVYTQYYQGQVQVVAYSMASNYQTASQIDETHYADYTNTSAIRPLFENNGDLAFVNMQYVSGATQATQIVAYSMASGYTTASQIDVTGYPYIQTADLSVIVPLFNGNGDLDFINLAYYAGQVQVDGYSQSSNYASVDLIDVTNYSDTTTPPVYPLLERLSS